MNKSSKTDPQRSTTQPATAERIGPAEQAHARLAAIVESSDDAILSKTLDGIITTWNAGAQRIFGYAAQEIIGQSILRLIPPELHDEEEQIIKRIKAGQRIEHYETERLTKDGHRVPVSLTISPLNDASGTIIGASKIARDITERKRAAEAIRVLNAQLSADLSAMTRMQQISTRLAQAEDFAQLLDEIVAAGTEITGADMGNIQLFQNGALQIVSQRGFAAPFLEFFNRVSRGSSACGAALERRERVIVEDVRQSPIFIGTQALEVMLAAGAIAVQSTPLVSRSGTLLGMFSTHYRTPRRPSDHELQMLDLLARQAADLIERTQTEASRRASEERYRTLFDLGPVAVYSCDASGVIREFNRRAAELWGRAPQPGDTDELFCGSHQMYRPDGTFMPHDQCPMAEVLAGTIPEARDMEVQIKRPDESWITVIVNIRVLKNERGDITGAINCFVDITDRKRIQEEARKAGERFRFMAESMPQKIFTADATGAVEYLNQQWLDYTGAPVNELKGEGWAAFLHPDDAPETLRCWQYAVETKESFEIVHRFRRADGVFRWHLSRAHAMPDERGHGSIWIGSNTDIHNERETGKQLERTTEELKHFAYAASHDLQEPLRMVTSYTQLLAEEYQGRLGESADQYIGYAVQGAHRMEALLKGMREYWQASERGEHQRAPTDTNAMLEQALLNLQESITTSGAMITHDPLPIVWADQTALVQVFQNLIGNAIKYRGDQPPHVHISAARNTTGEWMFSVKDNGIGIDPQFAEKVFMIFHRLNGNKYPGSGIGLSLCRKVIEHLGGFIWVESTIGQGATFRFTIPHRDESDGRQQERHPLRADVLF
jgi:PAS domain S-box-containing protein